MTGTNVRRQGELLQGERAGGEHAAPSRFTTLQNKGLAGRKLTMVQVNGVRAVIDADCDAARHHRMMAASNANMKNSIEAGKHASSALRPDASGHARPASRRQIQQPKTV